MTIGLRYARVRFLTCCFVVLTFLASVARARVAFTDPAPLNSNAATDSEHDFYPRIACDGDDTFVVAWASEEPLDGSNGSDHDIIFARSTNDGGSWSNVAYLNNGAGNDSDEDEQPDIAASASTWVVVWSSEKDAGNGDDVDTDIFFSRSTNGGASWSNSAPIHANEAADGYNSDRNPRIATDGSGTWVAVWESPAPISIVGQFDLDIVFSRSTDDGVTWSAPAHLNSNAVHASGADYNAFIASNGQHGWVVVWQSDDALDGSVSGDIDILTSYSTDDGATWSDAAFLNSDHATDQGDAPIGNDHNARALSLGGNDWIVTWDRASDIGIDLGMNSRSSDGGQSWSPPAAVEVPILQKAGTGGEMQFCDTPFMVYQGVGKGAPALGILTTFTCDIAAKTPPASKDSGHDYDIRMKFSADGGKTWTDSEFVNANAFSDIGDDETPVMASDTDGNLVVVWSSFDTLNNTIGGDADILFARASLAKFTELIAPNGGENWKRGKQQKIKWVTSLDKSENVKLDLLRNGHNVITISGATPNDGSFSWKVPDNIAKGGKYQVEITLNSDTNVKDRSLYEFKIK